MEALFAGRAERDRPMADDRLAELAAVCGVTTDMAGVLGHQAAGNGSHWRIST